MGMYGKNRIFKAAARDVAEVDVSETRGIRYMHLGSVTVQSAMRLSNPVDLELEYSRCMMFFAVLHPAPTEVVQIGLGGGSMVKFIHARLPGSRQTVIEINPQVEAAARSWFYVPEDDERLQTVIDDGADWISTRPHACDILVVDGFDGKSHAPSLTTRMFYTDCARAVRRNGVFVINLWGSDPRFNDTLNRIREAFNGRVICLRAEKRSNVAAFGFGEDFVMPARAELLSRARALESAFRYPLPDYVERLYADNPNMVVNGEIVC